jgi:hypothetical protein
MQCNIDARGKRYRLISGITCAAIAAALSILAFVLRAAFWPLLLAGIALLVMGLFQLFEARKGWCVMRAMGFKTPL